ncbi:hypothetical protein N9406_00950 [Verrucomicrobiales bacterium]|nr:hypothetical protein [Verrucomicrobiales bacterium]
MPDLRSINRFPSLVKYLRDELDWPIESDDFEDLVFDFTPEELGIDKKNAAKIEEIKRLRPLSTNQPWGIFFVKFDRKKLPVVALRRLLNAVALKKRASANNADQAAWHANDLLFISNYGEEDDRKICFANFSQHEEKKDLPVLKVLGWDDKDTALHLDDVAKTLENKFTWDEDYTEDPEGWGNQWRSAFSLAHGEVVRTSKDMAIQLAHLAQKIRNRINEILAIENDKGPITSLMTAFQEALIDDLDEDGFADMYAQTIAYGLLSARITNPSGESADDLPTAMPITNPFLKELMEQFLQVGGRKKGKKVGTGIDFDELGVSDVIALLDAANMEAVLKDFGDQNPQEDPVIHFFEGFLQEYDSQIRKDRGVFYTPRPVVSFIVRSVDELLRTEFGLEDGLADTTTWGEMAGRINDLEIPEGATPGQAFVQILDPATGTGTFLVEVIDLIHKTMTAKWQTEGHGNKKIDKLWNAYVPEHLLPRLHGYELMMAPYAIAHMKIGLKLYETGYRFESDERARVYLTNALEPAQDFSGTLAFATQALAHEAEAVNTIKRDQRFTVVIGNPPYSILSSNLSDLQRSLVEPYRYIDGERIRERGALQFEKNIQDDYVKFFAVGEGAITKTHFGVLAYISNGNYLDATTLRGLRASLSATFDSIRIVDLHGDGTGGGLPDADGIDENVFEIKQGVAIAAFSKNGARYRLAARGDVGGLQTTKYHLLSASTVTSLASQEISPEAPNYEFIDVDVDQERLWKSWPELPSLFGQFSAGVITARDHLVIDIDAEDLRARIRAFQSSKSSDKELLEEFQVSAKRGWDVDRARENLRSIKDIGSEVRQLSYRPFDTRWIFYDASLVWGRAYPTMRHLLEGDNVALSVCKQLTKRTEDWCHVFVSRQIGESGFVSNRSKEVTTFFPATLRGEPNDLLGQEATSNVKRKLLREFVVHEGRSVGIGSADSRAATAYIYSLLHSPEYRMRFRDQLARGFPRIPTPCDSALVTSLVDFGRELIDLHLMDAAVLADPISVVQGSGDFQVEKVSYSDETVWIDDVRTCGFKGVPEAVWNFKVGAYQVCEKWLKDRQAKGGKNPRPGRVLTDEDIEHYQKIVVALSETIRIMAEIDEVIEAHGGWPGAFQTGDAESVNEES